MEDREPGTIKGDDTTVSEKGDRLPGENPLMLSATRMTPGECLWFTADQKPQANRKFVRLIVLKNKQTKNLLKNENENANLANSAFFFVGQFTRLAKIRQQLDQ